MTDTIDIESVRFVKELYPRIREDQQRVEQFRETIDLLPPIVIARDGILVDGFHRWQAHRREKRTQIAAENLGDLSDLEIFKEACRLNAVGVMMLSATDKRKDADKLYRLGVRDYPEIASLLSLTGKTAQEYCRDARRDEKQEQQDQAWDLWLDCRTQDQIAAELNVTQQTVSNWIQKLQSVGEFVEPPASRQHFDVWTFQKADGESAYFGKLAPQIVENLLWLYTQPNDIVVDPFAGGGTVIDVAKRMGRRVWASDRKPSTPTLPIHQHDMTTGWPANAPRKASLVILDPPYWMQAAGRYSDDQADLANQPLEQFYASWDAVAKAAMDHADRIAYIVSPTQAGKMSDPFTKVIDHAFDMHLPFRENGWRIERRIIATYNTHQATGQDVEAAREYRKLLKLYRDLVVMVRG